MTVRCVSIVRPQWAQPYRCAQRRTHGMFYRLHYEKFQRAMDELGLPRQPRRDKGVAKTRRENTIVPTSHIPDS